jgi:hypothetical protein
MRFRWSGIAAGASLLLGGPLVLYLLDVASDRRYVVVVQKDTPLLTLPPHEYPNPNPAGAEVKSGQPVRVLRVRYGKDFESLKVETESGEVGWVVNGLGVEVVSRGSER